MNAIGGMFTWLRRMFGPACPECGRRTTNPESHHSPIWLCATCGLRYLPMTGGAAAARSTSHVTPFRRR